MGGLSLFTLQMKLSGEIRSQGSGLLSIQFSTGYWLALLGYVITLILGLLPGVKLVAEVAPVAAVRPQQR